MAKIGSSQKLVSPPGGRRLGGTPPPGDGGLPPGTPPTDGPPATPNPGSFTTLAQRLEYATLAGPLPAVPAAYDDLDWETILSDDVFARLYLSAPLYAQITDAQVAANRVVLAGFWQPKLNRFITGDRDVEVVYRPGTVSNALEQLETAAKALSNATGRAQCFAQLEARRQEAAGKKMDQFLRPLLQSPVLNNKVFQLALQEAVSFGFTLTEAEKYLLDSLRRADYAPVRTVTQSPNLLLAEWTPNGVPLTNRPSTKVLGHDVYTLTEAGQVLYEALAAGNDKVSRDLLSATFLVGIADDLKERSSGLDLREITQDTKLNQDQKRLSALYLLNSGLPFYIGKVGPAFSSPSQLLSRAASSARDFAVAEELFKQGVLSIWLRAAATAGVQAALPAPGQVKAADFRFFLHKAAPNFPLWIGEEPFAGPAQLAAYIQRDEHTWKMVYGSLAAGNLVPWLQAQGRPEMLERQAQLADALLGPGLEPDSEQGRQLAVQALLEALDPEAAVPSLNADLSAIELTGLSGETQTARVLTLTNETGGPVRVLLDLQPPLEGVGVLPKELFFNERAPGQKLPVTILGNPVLMPRDGVHTTQLTVRTAYVAGGVPVRAGAVFPLTQFLQFVGGAALALAVVFGGVRYLLGLMLGETDYAGMTARGELLPLDRAVEAGYTPALLVALLLLGGLSYAFVRVLAQLAKSRSLT